MATLTLTVTPFQNDQEVQKFLELAYSNDIKDKREAIHKLDQLEARVNPLPLGLGSLKHILKVEIIRGEQQEKNQFDENNSLQYACAVAVLKFVDAVSVPYRAFHSRLSYRSIAKQVDLPGNIISLRHDIAHHHELPSLNDLLAAVEFSKQWLRKNCLDELIETMALFSQGAYGEVLDIIARETINAFVHAHLNFSIKRSRKRLRLADERAEEVRKALQMCTGKEIIAEVLVQCGHLIMVPNQLARLNYNSESTDLLPSCVIQFWKPILQHLIIDHHLVSLVVDKIFVFLSDYYQLPSNNPSIIDRQRIGWIFYFLEQSSIQLDHSLIFIRLAQILQPWFAEQLSQMVVRMADDMNGSRKGLISEQKRDTLLRTISMFANPFEFSTEEQITSVSPMNIYPRNELNKKEMTLFKKRPIVSDVPLGLVCNETEQNLEMNIDLSKTDRNFLGCTPRVKPTCPVPTKRMRTSSPSIDPSLFQQLIWRQSNYR